MFARIKEKLRNSGVNCSLQCLLKNNLSLDTQIQDSFSPFDALIEDPDYPMAKIYREGIRITNIYNFLVGDHYDLKNTGRGCWGMLDYILLGLPLIGRRLIGLRRNAIGPLSRVTIPLVFVGFLLEAPRIILGGILTLALVFPVKALVNGLTYFKARKLKENRGTLKIVSERRENLTSGQQITSTLLKDLKIDLYSIQIQPSYKSKGPFVMTEEEVGELEEISVMNKNFFEARKDSLKDAPVKVRMEDHSYSLWTRAERGEWRFVQILSEEKAEEKTEEKKETTSQTCLSSETKPIIRLAIHLTYTTCRLGFFGPGLDTFTYRLHPFPQPAYYFEVSEENYDAIKAWIETNTAGILGALKKHGVFQQVQWQVTERPSLKRMAFLASMALRNKHVNPAGYLLGKSIYCTIFHFAGIANEKQIAHVKDSSPKLK